MKSSRILAVISLLAILLVYLIVLGGPVRNKLTVGSCGARYTYFLTNNRYCNWRTHGHCTDNSIERYNAISDAANCLWIQYLSTHDEAVIRELEKLIKADDRLVGLWISKSVVERVTDQEKVIFGHITIE